MLFMQGNAVQTVLNPVAALGSAYLGQLKYVTMNARMFIAEQGNAAAALYKSDGKGGHRVNDSVASAWGYCFFAEEESLVSIPVLPT